MSSTGPYYMERWGPPVNIYGQRDWGVNRTWFRQTKPYHERLPFEMSYVELTRGSYDPSFSSASSSIQTASQMKTVAFDRALSMAYAKFRSSVGEQAQLGVAVAEIKQAHNMIASRVSQVLKFAKHLRAFEIPAALSTLGISIRKTRKTKYWTRTKVLTSNGEKELTFKTGAQNFGNNFLEVHFGWEPLLGDIGDAMKVLSRRIRQEDHGTCSARASSTFNQDINWPPGYLSRGSRYVFTSRVQLKAEVFVTNPNLYLANRAGFINPLSVAWELVPFSFVVDWFSNVGQVLGAWTDWVGLDLKNPAQTHFVTSVENDYTEDAGLRWHGQWRRVAVSRTLGIQTPNLVLTAPKWPSATRGLTAVALLTQFLRK